MVVCWSPAAVIVGLDQREEVDPGQGMEVVSELFGAGGRGIEEAPLAVHEHDGIGHVLGDLAQELAFIQQQLLLVADVADPRHAVLVPPVGA